MLQGDTKYVCEVRRKEDQEVDVERETERAGPRLLGVASEKAGKTTHTHTHTRKLKDGSARASINHR